MRAVFTAVALTTFVLAGCNTVAGVGEDISGAARMVQNGVGGGY